MKDSIKQLLINRARIIKSAQGKAPLSLDVLNKYYEPGQKWIICCDSQEQLNQVLLLLNNHGYDAMEYHTGMEGDPTQTLRLFETNGGIVVSIRCLDEGVDIPSVSHALILASSKNPREFIQRRGRVLRKAPNKPLAFIHDALVTPNNLDGDTHGLSIIESELARAIQFGKGADNPSSIAELQRIALRAGIDYERLAEDGFEDE
jgi:superfamily II DNA or RNA helicase